MSLKRYDFQEEAIEWLIDSSASSTTKKTLVLKAPTGSGKTVILIQYINRFLSEHKNTAFVWLCPGKGDLEEQSRNSMIKFIPTRQTYDLFEALSSGFTKGSTTFINWERVTKSGNKAITPNEKKNLYERIDEAANDGTEFILIIDEEHSNNTSRAQDIIDYFKAKHIVRVSATTISSRDVEYKEISELDVIEEGLITSAISVNEDVEENAAEDDALLLKLADKKRKAIYKAYQDRGIDIRPLVLIQFPNGEPDRIEYVEKCLSDMGYTRENKMVAAWLSGDKKDIPEDLTENTSELSFLFIKQAINTGWDCPRAKILVKIREGEGEAFRIQTIGRIRRMPEQKHYDEDILDLCYVYTFDKTFSAGLLKELEKAYIPKRLFLKEAPRELELTKELKDEDGGNVDVRAVYNLIRKLYVDKYQLNSDKEMNKKKLSSRYKFEDCILGEIFQGVVVLTESLEEGENTVTTRTPVNTHIHGMALRHTFDEFKNILGIRVDVIRQIFDKLFSFKHHNRDKLLCLGHKEYYAFIINNAQIIKEDLRSLPTEVEAQTRLLEPKTSKFKIPLEELYHFDPLEKNHKVFESNAYKEYTKQYVTSDCGKSTPEIMFEEYCERNDKVDWVYKNGDSGQNYFSIVYVNNVNKRQKLFYPDYILKLKDGSIWIIEAKGGQKGKQDYNIDKQAINKFETFKRYAKEYDINWGFVRNKDTDLYLNNTEWADDMRDDNWKLLDNFF